MGRIDRLGLRVAFGVVVLACAAVPASAAAATHKPVIKHFALTGSPLTEAAGVAKLKVQVRGATSCTIDGPGSVVGVEWTGRCSAHARVHEIWIPANTSERVERLTLTLSARGPGGVTRRRLTVVVPGESKLELGVWRLTIGEFGAPGGESNDVELLADGTWIAEKDTVGGQWSYAHREIHFTLPGSVTISAVGGPKGPLLNPDDTVESGGKTIHLSVRFERVGGA
jgi:hypothetical protein